MTAFTSSDLLIKQRKTLKILSAIFLFLSYAIGIGTLILTIYLLSTPRGMGAWILPAFTFLAGAIVFLFLFSFSKVINLLIEISNK